MNWRWDFVESLLAGKQPRRGAEIGVKEGRFISHMLQKFPDLIMCAVDPWEDQPEGNESYIGWDWNSIYSQYREKIKPYNGRVREYRMYSEDAAELIEDASLDFVFIDAQHDYKSVKQDIQFWISKVKPGGLLCGHDHDNNFPGVKRAVSESFDAYKVGRNAVWYVWL